MAKYAIGYPEIWGLFHDASEAYLPDVASTIKQCFPLIISAEENILIQIQQCFELPKLSKEEKHNLKQMDLALQYWEGKQLLPLHPEAMWAKEPQLKTKLSINCWPPEQAKQEFINFGRKFLFLASGKINE